MKFFLIFFHYHLIPDAFDVFGGLQNVLIGAHNSDGVTLLLTARHMDAAQELLLQLTKFGP